MKKGNKKVYKHKLSIVFLMNGRDFRVVTKTFDRKRDMKKEAAKYFINQYMEIIGEGEGIVYDIIHTTSYISDTILSRRGET